jgi:hypothetical protein
VVSAAYLQGFCPYLSATAGPHLSPAAPRYGTWAHYRADVALVRAVVTLLGWTLTEPEGKLLAELERYGGQDPARRRVAAEHKAVYVVTSTASGHRRRPLPSAGGPL